MARTQKLETSEEAGEPEADLRRFRAKVDRVAAGSHRWERVVDEPADVALVIGANDVVNPAARDDKRSPIFGTPILDVDKAQTAVVIKRGRGAGFAGIENSLFYADNTRMVCGDAQAVVSKLIAGVKKV